jgi:hypothetical protein
VSAQAGVASLWVEVLGRAGCPLAPHLRVQPAAIPKAAQWGGFLDDPQESEDATSRCAGLHRPGECTRTRAGVWRAVTGLMAVVGLDPHDATHLYRTRGADLEVVQEQRGHASIQTTPIYAKVTKEDKLHAASALAKRFRDSQQHGNSVAGWPLRFPGNAGKGARTVATF